MKIARLIAPKTYEIVDEPVPSIAPDQVLIRTAVCGVCASEMEPWLDTDGKTQYPRYNGHEVSGVIEKTGRDVSSHQPGDRVAIWTLGRGYAEYVVEKAVHCFSAGDVPFEQALGEPLACAVNSVELAGLSLGDDVVIIGAGFMGNLVQKLVQLQGPRLLIVADIHPDALQRALKLGATCVVNLQTENLAEVVKDLTGGSAADVSFEVTGQQGPLQLLGEVTRMSGKLVVVGYHGSGSRSIPLGYWNWMAFQILNAHFRDVTTILVGMRTGMRLLTSGRLSLDGLISHCFSLEQINQAFQTVLEKPDGFTKAVIKFI